MHNSLNSTLQLCSFSGNNSQNLTRRGKWKVPPSILSFPLKEFSPSGEERDTSRPPSRQSVRCCQPSHFRATFAALFRSTKLRRDFHKAQCRTENSPVIREWQRKRKGWYGAAKWKGNFAIHIVKTHGMSYPLSSLDLGRDSLQESQKFSKLWSILQSLYIVIYIVVSKKAGWSNISLKIEVCRQRFKDANLFEYLSRNLNHSPRNGQHISSFHPQCLLQHNIKDVI